MTLEQKKLIACAELAGLKHKVCNCGCGREYWVAEYGTSFQICLFATSLDAIVPVVIKWCGEDDDKFIIFMRQLAKVTSGNQEWYNYPKDFRKNMFASPSKILDALLLAAGKMPVE